MEVRANSLLRLGFCWRMITAWNLLRFPDEEKDLPDDVRERVHLVMGRDKEGKVIYFSRLGAMQDFLDWFGLDTPVQTVRDFLNGPQDNKRNSNRRSQGRCQ